MGILRRVIERLSGFLIAGLAFVNRTGLQAFILANELSNTSIRRPAGLGSSVGCVPGGRGFAAPVGHHSFVEIDHEIFCMVILSFPLIQEGKFSVTCERMS